MEISILDRILFFGILSILGGMVGLRVIFNMTIEGYWWTRFHLQESKLKKWNRELESFIDFQARQLAEMEHRVRYVKSQEKITSAFLSNFLYCGVVTEEDAEIISKHIPQGAYFGYDYLGEDDFTMKPLYHISYEPDQSIAHWLQDIERQNNPLVEGDYIW